MTTKLDLDQLEAKAQRGVLAPMPHLLAYDTAGPGETLALIAELRQLRTLAEAAGPMRDGHEGCVTEPPCGSCFRCDFDRAVDAYRGRP